MSTDKPDTHQLLIGHLNIYQLYNKVPDLCVMLSQPNAFDMFGITESRLCSNISDEAISVPGFLVFRSDPASPKHTGISVYLNISIRDCARKGQI